MSATKQKNKNITASPKSFALGKINFIIIAFAIILIVVGFILMTGPATTIEGGFEPDIFSVRRVKVAPLMCFIGFLVIIVGILYPDKNKN